MQAAGTARRRLPIAPAAADRVSHPGGSVTRLERAGVVRIIPVVPRVTILTPPLVGRAGPVVRRMQDAMIVTTLLPASCIQSSQPNLSTFVETMRPSPQAVLRWPCSAPRPCSPGRGHGSFDKGGITAIMRLVAGLVVPIMHANTICIGGYVPSKYAGCGEGKDYGAQGTLNRMCVPY